MMGSALGIYLTKDYIAVNQLFENCHIFSLCRGINALRKEGYVYLE